MSEQIKSVFTPDEIKHCIEVLENLSLNPRELFYLPAEMRIALLKAAGKLSHPDPEELKNRKKEVKKLKQKINFEKEKKARSLTGIRKARENSVFSAPLQLSEIKNHEYMKLESPRNCYICKTEYTELHFFYDALCPHCAEFNYKKRFQTASLKGRVALITGSRLKIGYQATLMLLRAGASVIATTRFPVDSALRYSKEKDFNEFKDRLHIYGLDLRHTPSVEIFVGYIEQTYDRLDFLINNAAQTVRRPPGFYAHLMPLESKPFNNLPQDAQALLYDYRNCLLKINQIANAESLNNSDLPVNWHGKKPGIGLSSSAMLSQIPYSYDDTLNVQEIFPSGQLDADLQQVDLRQTNSWRLKMGEIQTSEMLELQLVNAIAPFVLCNKLIPLMKKDNTGEKHIVNVSAMEGKFLRFKKGERHPHTNMAKAALNMLTHTAASDLPKYGIYMNAVDTGWVTDEDPVLLARFKQDKHDFQPPLDIVDGAARVLDPIFDGILTGHHWNGKFLKDYKPIDW